MFDDLDLTAFIAKYSKGFVYSNTGVGKILLNLIRPAELKEMLLIVCYKVAVFLQYL